MRHVCTRMAKREKREANATEREPPEERGEERKMHAIDLEWTEREEVVW